jgi:hypothetical protein
MFIFNANTLMAAKNVGVPLSVLLGILAIFGALFQVRNINNRATFFILAAGGAIAIASLIFVLWISTREIYQWVDTKALADWAGNDEGWTDTREPLQMYCDRSREGNIATCWSNRREGYPDPNTVMFSGTGNMGAWCTYKLREKIAVGRANGEALGRVYICARVSL